MPARVGGTFAARECADAADLRLFYGLPARLVRAGRQTDEQSVPETKHVIQMCAAEGKHFRLFVCCDGEGRAVCRCALSWRDGWDAGHVGFFESDGNEHAVCVLFTQVREAAVALGLTQLVGPVNGSIWDAYRYKVAGFEQGTYTCDRNTPRDYPQLWEAAGFARMQTWHSDLIGSVIGGKTRAKLERRLARAQKLGYRFAYVGEGGFMRGLSVLWRLIVELYAGFPAFEPVSEEGFAQRFKGLRWLLDPRCALLAYDAQGEPVGFGIALPDYAQALVQAAGGLGKLAALVRTRVRPARYVIAYVGVKSGHEGLGGALCGLLAHRQEETGAQGVAALMAEGKPTASYAGSQGVPTWHYALYRLSI